jgi:hypothetical protein
VALDVILCPTEMISCACGHEDDPRFPHIYEGSAMSHLCRRLRLNQPTKLKLARLSQNGWSPGSHDLEGYQSEVEWFGSHDQAVRTLEAICGPCEDDDAVIRKVFDSTSWMTIQ